MCAILRRGAIECKTIRRRGRGVPPMEERLLITAGTGAEQLETSDGRRGLAWLSRCCQPELR